jgi:uncharacterized protein (TIGR02001 family)
MLHGARRNAVRRVLRQAIFALVPLAAATQATAQVTGAISIESDFRLRGYSMSGGQPVASARVGFDDGSGLYADGSATLVATRHDGPRFLGFQVAGGFATRVGAGWTIDAGIAHNELRAPYGGGFSYDYTEAYAGATRGPLSAYVFVSPNYFRPGFKTVYGQIEATITPAEDWYMTAHIGSLTYLDAPEPYRIRDKTLYDWRFGVARELGNLEVHATVSGGGPGRQRYYGEAHSRTAVTAGASLSF